MIRCSVRLATTFIIAFILINLLPAHGAVPLMDNRRGIPTLAPLLAEITPAVVNISVITHTTVQANPLFQDPFFRRFFDMPQRRPSRPRMSAGSGVIVDADKGHVLTNHHVIDQGDKIVVTLKDRRRFDAELVGSDPATDIALLKIEPDDLTALHLGDSDQLFVGDFVVAIGNPFGLGQTVTSGIVSALRRSGLRVEGYEDFIQTDAPINPGNSGGALVTIDGRLIGINTAIVAPAGGNVGIGFAVPSNMAEAIMGQLVEFGEVRRGRLGVVIQDFTPDIAEAMGVAEDGGAVISKVEPNSPAEKAGLRAGDVVLAVNDRPIGGSSDLRNVIGLMRAGADVKLTLLRDGKRKNIQVELERSERATAKGSETSAKLAGAEFRNLEQGMPHYGKIRGVVVSKIEPGSPASRYGLEEGDIIVGVDRHLVTDVAELRKLLSASAHTILLDIVRGNAKLFLVIR